MIKILNVVLTLLRNQNPAVVAVFAASSALLTVWHLFTTMWTALITRLDALVIAQMGGSVSFAPLGFIDRLFPLTEMLNFVTAYAAIRLACTGIRIIKSFIPTIA